MPTIMRKGCISLTLTVLLLSPFMVEAFGKERVKVHILQYHGAEEGSALNNFGVFKGIIHRKLKNLRREVSQKWSGTKGSSKTLDYLSELSDTFKDKDTFSNAKGVNTWIRNESEVLSVLRGTILPNPDKTYSVLSEIHLGDFEENLKFEVLSVELPVVKQEFSNTKDSHSAVFLYALAMDAKRLGYAKDHIALFLKPAADNLSDIKRRQGQLSEDLAEVERAIKQSCRDIFGDETWCFGTD